MAQTHSLKTWPDYFDAVARNEKSFEVRKADRPFVVGDTLLLREWYPDIEGYSGREIWRRIDYILQGGQFGIEPGFVVMGIS